MMTLIRESHLRRQVLNASLVRSVLTVAICVGLPELASAEFIPVFSGPTDAGTYQVAGITDSGLAVATDSFRSVWWNSTSHGEMNGVGRVSSINRFGVAVGTVGTPLNLNREAVRWDAATNVATQLADLGEDSASSLKQTAIGRINSNGTATGYAWKYNGNGVVEPGVYLGNRAVRWQASGTDITELGGLGEGNDGVSTSAAYGTNAHGVTVGMAFTYDDLGLPVEGRPVLWDANDTSAVELGTIPNPPGLFGSQYAADITDAGRIFGQAEYYGPVGSHILQMRPLRWEPGHETAVELGGLGVDAIGSQYALITKVNQDGTAIGWGDKYDTAGEYLGTRAVRWDIDEVGAIELETLGEGLNGFGGTFANDANEAGFSVGSAKRFDGSDLLDDAAVLWKRDGSIVNLNDLVDPNSGWYLIRASKISDTGWIAGDGMFDPDGPGGPAQSTAQLFVIQVPFAAVPEPGTLELLGLSICTGAALYLSRWLRNVPAHSRCY